MVMNSLICRHCPPLEGKGVVVLLEFISVTFSIGYRILPPFVNSTVTSNDDCDIY